METHYIELTEEEVDSLLKFNSIEIFEDEDKDIKIKIYIPNTIESHRRFDILNRYNNEQYWEDDSHYK